MTDFSQFAFCATDDADDAEVLSKPVKKVKLDKIRRTVAEAVSPMKKQRILPAKSHKTVVSIVPPVGLSEMYKSHSTSVERPLRLLIVGHNPSDQSYTKGHFYANPSNRMWYLLTKAGIVPSHFMAKNDTECPELCGIGFTDLICGVSETKSNKFTDSEVRTHGKSLYGRILRHIERAATESGIPSSQCYPKIIAFSGVRQWKMLFPAGSTAFKSSTISSGTSSNSSSGTSRSLLAGFLSPASCSTGADDCQELGGAVMTYRGSAAETRVGATTTAVIPSSSSSSGTTKKRSSNTTSSYGVQTIRPPDWPHYLSDSVVFVLPSSSGAAAMTNEEREAPYLRLGELLRAYAWPSVVEEGKEMVDLTIDDDDDDG